MVKVLLIVPREIAVGGVEAYIANTYSHMNLSDISVDVFAPARIPPENCFVSKWREIGFTIYEHPIEGGRVKRLFSLGWSLYHFLKSHHYDIVHTHITGMTLIATAILCARIRKVPYRVVHSHFCIVSNNIFRKAVSSICRKVIVSCATDLTACSDGAAEYCFGKKAAKHAVIARNGIDAKKFCFHKNVRTRLRKQLELENCFVIGHVGRFEEQKNHRFLLEIFRETVRRDERARLLLIGAGSLEEEMRRLAERYHIGEKVIFLGTTDVVEDYMCAMDIFAFPSLFEGLGIVSIEAQASGLPCVVADTVPREAEITDRIEFLPLTAGADVWADKLLQYHPDSYRKDRESAWHEVYDAGYDILETAKTIQRIYEKAQENGRFCP